MSNLGKGLDIVQTIVDKSDDLFVNKKRRKVELLKELVQIATDVATTVSGIVKEHRERKDNTLILPGIIEEKIQKLEAAKLKLDDIEKKEKPINDRKLAYHQIDDLLFEALVEKHEEGRPEKMVEYLKLRKEIKDKHPLED